MSQYAKVEYVISAAVFDAKGQLLGAAAHREQVEYEREGRMPTVAREIDLDFGVSKSFSRAAFAAVAISEPEVPNAG